MQTIILLAQNGELNYGFKQISLQVSYLFPIIGLVYGLVGYTQSRISNPAIDGARANLDFVLRGRTD